MLGMGLGSLLGPVGTLAGGGLDALLGVGAAAGVGAGLSRFLPNVGFGGPGGGAGLNLGGMARGMAGGQGGLESLMQNVNFNATIPTGRNSAFSIGADPKSRMYEEIMKRLSGGSAQDVPMANPIATATIPNTAATQGMQPMMGMRGLGARRDY